MVHVVPITLLAATTSSFSVQLVVAPGGGGGLRYETDGDAHRLA